MRRSHQGQAVEPVVKSQHLIYGFVGSFLFALTSSLLYGSNLVFLKSAKTLDERLLIGLSVPNDAVWRAAVPSNDGTNQPQVQPKVATSSYITTTRMVPEPIGPCGNSERWLNSRRYGNLNNDALFTADLAKSLLLNLDTVLLPESKHNSVLPTQLNQSICHANSRFLNSTIPTLSSSSSSMDDKRSFRLWSFKLIYLSIHYHQHRLALPEAKARFAEKEEEEEKPTTVCPNSEELWTQHGVGIFDYECPDAKYLIMPLGGNGLGSNIRGGTVLAYLLGLMTNRIVIFVNNAEQGSHYLQHPWPLASCERFDYQCFFMPPTPCTVTQDEIGNAYQITNQNFRAIMKRGSKLAEVAHYKVWTVTSQFVPITYYPRTAIQLLQKYAEELVAAVPEDRYHAYVKHLKEAAATIGEKDDLRDGYNYASASFKVHHALTLYSLRPNPTSAKKLANTMADIIPKDLDPERAVGLPIRASDKCGGESECLSFDQHMQVAGALWSKHQANMTSTTKKSSTRTPSIVFTTESRQMVKEQQAYAASMTDKTFDFVTNAQDVLPDSGFMKNVSSDLDADEIMLSAMSSLQAQLLPKITIGNCCSNFHTMLNDLLSEGCGAADDNKFVCLQEYEDPRLRVCCGWHTTCPANRDKAIRELERLE